MEHNQHYEKLKAIVDKCDRCGACTTVCPLYKVDRKDRATSRGKIAIVRALLEDKLDGNEKALRHALDYCLLCKACTEVCPGKVMTDQAMIEMRQWLREDHGLSPKYRLIGPSSVPLRRCNFRVSPAGFCQRTTPRRKVCATQARQFFPHLRKSAASIWEKWSASPISKAAP